MTATATAPVKGVDEVIDAMRSIQTEGDRWKLADRLVVLIPKGDGKDGLTFDTLLDQAHTEGVGGRLSRHTLRLYRDTANRWPSAKRVPNVSFSAHREAMTQMEGSTVDKAADLLLSIAKAEGGADKVTAGKVRQAVNLKKGKVATPAPASGVPTAPKVDALSDLRQGGKQLIAAITVNTDPKSLDDLEAGLNKVLAHVEKLRARAAQKAKGNAKTVPTVAAKPRGAKPAARKGAGDMRGL